MRFKFDRRKSEQLKRNPRRGIGFSEAKEVWSKPYCVDKRADDPEQFRAIGWVAERLFTVIFEVRADVEGEYCHLVTLWKSTAEERKMYEENS